MLEIIEELKAEDWYRDQIVNHRSSENRDPQLGWLSSSVWGYTINAAFRRIIHPIT